MSVRSPWPVWYKGVERPLGFRMDIVVGRAVLAEVKATAALMPTMVRNHVTISG